MLEVTGNLWTYRADSEGSMKTPNHLLPHEERWLAVALIVIWLVMLFAAGML